ncbi:MAG: CaiB/BaiF CoA transferase family protein [Burkholderiaceae bacterium]
MHTTANSDASAMLEGLTVLDLSQGASGPYAGVLLRQQGARVIKVEPPSGDWARHIGRARDGQTAIAIANNVGKESVVVDARTDAGRKTLRRLAEQADVVIQNFRPGVAERMGVGYAELAAARPGLVYVSISGYGATGPMADLPALDTTVQALSGLMHSNRDATGQPQKIGLVIVDLATAIYAAQYATAALFRAARTGQGRHVQVTMLETAAALQSYILLDDAMFPGKESAVLGAPVGLFKASDGMLYVSLVNDAMFERLARGMGFDDWLADESLRASAGRMPRAQELNERLGRHLATNTVAHWSEVLTRSDVLFAPARHSRELRSHPQSLHTGLFASVDQPGLGELPWPNLPGLSGLARPIGHAPALGEHTQAVLQEFGIDEKEAT